MTGRRAKYSTMLLLVVGSGLALLAATQPWFTIRLTDTAEHSSTVAVAGSTAAPALTALALAGLALTAALAIAGPVFRIVLALLGVLLGVSVLISAITAVSDAVRASVSAITTATGVAGDASIRRLVHSVDTQLWPWVAVAGGVLIVLASAAAVVFSRLWPGASRKYQTRFAGEDGRSVEEIASTGAGDADEMADAAGPDRAAHPAEAPARGDDETDADTPDEPRTLDRDTAIDSWDELTRGDDPTK
ncbi:Trp biosynthesis-associated membrane protein [Leifsonia shinshuensis]|uniref:Trp biosynthesis-associated membrane protein n=1 Tax=Leifsonia shinshuensis TaxID=150026 RepID=UPI0028664F3C|nr:Trp biosynthesis-associated membrane protein [Leifsonia shinshuensis]MDR6970702.1 putative membrane protein (TIGR02234 family) [Leifsonia shinshuensis]